MSNQKEYTDNLCVPGEFVKFRGMKHEWRKEGDVLREDRVAVVLRRDDVRALLLSIAYRERWLMDAPDPFDGTEYCNEQADAAFAMLTEATGLGDDER